jgi:septation ring formation regulator EzrA
MNPVAKITIDDLAIMIQKGFLHADAKLEEFKGEMYEFRDHMLGFERETKFQFREIDKRFERIECRLDSIEEKLDKSDEKFSLLFLEVVGHEKRITTLETATAK